MFQCSLSLSRQVTGDIVFSSDFQYDARPPSTLPQNPVRQHFGSSDFSCFLTTERPHESATIQSWLLQSRQQFTSADSSAIVTSTVHFSTQPRSYDLNIQPYKSVPSSQLYTPVTLAVSSLDSTSTANHAVNCMLHSCSDSCQKFQF